MHVNSTDRYFPLIYIVCCYFYTSFMTKETASNLFVPIVRQSHQLIVPGLCIPVSLDCRNVPVPLTGLTEYLWQVCISRYLWPSGYPSNFGRLVIPASLACHNFLVFLADHFNPVSLLQHRPGQKYQPGYPHSRLQSLLHPSLRSWNPFRSSRQRSQDHLHRWFHHC